MANSIIAIVKNETLNINEVREGISKIDEKLQKECFGTEWIKQSKERNLNPNLKENRGAVQPTTG